MSHTITASFDGKTIVPDQPLPFPNGQRLRVQIETLDEPPIRCPKSPAWQPTWAYPIWPRSILNTHADANSKSSCVADCASFVVVRRHNLQDALTSDEHFVQAGFRAMLREAVP